MFEELSKQVHEVAEECAKPEWDGYGAKPISPSAVQRALCFIRALPTEICFPDVVPEPNGYIGFEWTKDGKILSVGTYERAIVYAFLGLNKRQSSEEPFEYSEYSLPQSVEALLCEHFR